MSDLSTAATMATAVGTLVLGCATFAAVRSANRAARTAERALQAGLRPVLFPSRLDDPTQKVMWLGRHFARVPGGRAVLEVDDDVLYLAIGLRNVGTGIAVLHGWFPWPEWQGADQSPAPLSGFRRQTRDLFVPPGDIGFWQGAIREATDSARAPILAAMADGEQISIDLLYGDLEGGQRTISRFGLTPIESGGWLVAVARHWHLDRDDPR